MKKLTFPQYVLQQFECCDIITDEELCAGYIEKYYIHFWKKTPIAVIGKKYESCRNKLWLMSKRGDIVESHRIHRKNGSDEIFFKKARC